MALKMHTKCFQVVDYFDLEALVKETTGREWSFVAAQECGNDTDHTFDVSTTHWDLEYHNQHPEKSYRECFLSGLDKYNDETMRKWVAGDAQTYPYPQVVLNWLAVNGHILPGNYLIEVSW